MAIVKTVPIKLSTTDIIEILSILTFIEAKLYNPIKINVRPVPKNHKASALNTLKKIGVRLECNTPKSIKA